MPSFDTEWNIFYTCNITLDQFTVTKPLVSPGGGVPPDVPVKCKVGVINENVHLATPRFCFHQSLLKESWKMEEEVYWLLEPLGNIH